MNGSVKWTNCMLKLLCVQVQSLPLYYYGMNCVDSLLPTAIRTNKIQNLLLTV